MSTDFVSIGPLNPYDYYVQRIKPLIPIVYSIHECGMRIDQDKLEHIREDVVREISEREAKLQSRLGFIPNTKSYIHMEKVFNACGVEFARTEKGRPKNSEDALLGYAQKYPDAREVIVDCLKITEQRTLASHFLRPSVDEAGYYHPMLVPNGAAATGRFAGKGALEGGFQPQNVPKYVRKIVIPDTSEHEFIQADLRQAEAMIVAWDAQDELMIQAFQTINPLTGKPVDIHGVRGCLVFRNWRSSELPPWELIGSIERVCPMHAKEGASECPESERQTAKITGHMSNYMAGARKLVTHTLPKAGIFISEARGKEIQRLVISKAVRAWWKSTELEAKRSPIFYNGAGRYREFYGIYDDELLRSILAWKAQSTVGDITNCAMIQLHEKLNAQPNYQARIVTQTHDSLLVCSLKHARNEVVRMMREAFDHRLNYHGRDLTIPIDIAYGQSWGDLA